MNGSTIRTFRPLDLLLGVVVLTLVVGGVVLAPRWAEARQNDQRYDAVLAAAKREALAFTTLDHRTLKADTARVLAGSTGSFKRQFKGSREQLTDLATQNESVSKGTVLSAGVVSADADSARVIVVADSMVSNINTPRPQPRHYRLQLDLVRLGHRWLVSDLEFVS